MLTSVQSSQAGTYFRMAVSTSAQMMGFNRAAPH
jgi:hypothetical protein